MPVNNIRAMARPLGGAPATNPHNMPNGSSHTTCASARPALTAPCAEHVPHSSTVHALLQGLAAQDATWVRRHRALNTLGLFAIIAAKRGRRDAVWKGQQYLNLLADGLVPAANVNPASVSKALKRMPLGTFHRVHEHLTTDLLQRPGAILCPPPGLRRIYAVDSSKVDLPPKMAALGYRPMQQGGATPKLTLSTIIDVRTGILVACDYSPSFDERAALLRLVARNVVPPGTVLLADRGYYSQQVWNTLAQHHIHPLFRCKSNADNTIKAAFLNGRSTKHVMLHGKPAIMHRWATARDGKRAKKWPNRTLHPATPSNNTHLLRPDIQQEPPVPKGQELVLLSTLDFTRHEAVETYQLRWQVETAYNIVKNSLGLGGNEGAPHTIMHTLHALTLLHTFLRLLELGDDRNRVYNPSGTLGRVWTQTSTTHHHTACALLAHALTHRHAPPPHARTIVVTVYVPQLPPPPPPPPDIARLGTHLGPSRRRRLTL